MSSRSLVIVVGLAALVLGGCGDNRWRDRAIKLWPEPSAAERAAFLEVVRADALQYGTDHSGIPDSDLIDAARFLCAAMAAVRKEDHRIPKEGDLDEAVSAAMERFDFGRAKVRTDDDPRIVNRDPKDVDVALGYGVSNSGFGNFCPKQAPGTRR